MQAAIDLYEAAVPSAAAVLYEKRFSIGTLVHTFRAEEGQASCIACDRKSTHRTNPGDHPVCKQHAKVVLAAYELHDFSRQVEAAVVEWKAAHSVEKDLDDIDQNALIQKQFQMLRVYIQLLTC